MFSYQTNSKYHPSRDPFADLKSFVTVLCDVQTVVLGMHSSQRLPHGTIAILSSGNEIMPSGVDYLAPRGDDRLDLLEDLRRGCLKLENREERARLLYLGLQLIHPLEDANGRVGRVLFEIVRTSDFVRSDQIKKVVDRSPFSREGTQIEFTEHCAHPLHVCYELSRYGLFSEMFGAERASRIKGITWPDLDQSTMEEYGALAKHIRDVDEEVGRDLTSHLRASRYTFSPLKLIAVLDLERANGFDRGLLFEGDTDAGHRAIAIQPGGDLITRMSLEDARQDVPRMWDLNKRLVQLLIRNFETDAPLGPWDSFRKLCKYASKPEFRTF